MTMTEAFVPGPRMHVPGAAAGPLAGLTFAVKEIGRASCRERVFLSV